MIPLPRIDDLLVVKPLPATRREGREGVEWGLARHIARARVGVSETVPRAR